MEKDLKDKKKETKIHPADRDGYDPFTCDVEADEEQATKLEEEVSKELGLKK